MKRSLLALGAAALTAALISGCVAAGPAPAPHVAVAADAPFYYQGYPVYYDGWGYPIFYIDGVVHYVPRSSRYELLASRYRGAPSAAPYAYRHWHGRG
jgi:hypothetical protein